MKFGKAIAYTFRKSNEAQGIMEISDDEWSLNNGLGGNAVDTQHCKLNPYLIVCQIVRGGLT